MPISSACDGNGNAYANGDRHAITRDADRARADTDENSDTYTNGDGNPHKDRNTDAHGHEDGDSSIGDCDSNCHRHTNTNYHPLACCGAQFALELLYRQPSRASLHQWGQYDRGDLRLPPKRDDLRSVRAGATG